jgi:DNA modification methylase
MGGGSTIAAAVSIGYESIGIEIDPQFFGAALEAIPALAALPGNGRASREAGKIGNWGQGSQSALTLRAFSPFSS